MRGRPSKRTEALEHDILTVLRLGLSYRTAAQYVKIAESTLRKWGDEDAEFSAACEKARAQAVVNNVTKLIQKINDGDKTCLIFWLKSRTEEFKEQKYEIYQDGGEYNPDETFL